MPKPTHRSAKAAAALTPAIIEIFAAPPLLSTEDGRADDDVLANLANAVHPGDIIACLLIKDIADKRTEIMREASPKPPASIATSAARCRDGGARSRATMPSWRWRGAPERHSGFAAEVLQLAGRFGRTNPNPLTLRNSVALIFREENRRSARERTRPA